MLPWWDFCKIELLWWGLGHRGGELLRLLQAGVLRLASTPTCLLCRHPYYKHLSGKLSDYCGGMPPVYVCGCLHWTPVILVMRVP